jgi:hypothetical protein
MQIVEFFPNTKGYLQCHIREREGSTVALLDFLILISKRPIHQEFSQDEGVHHDQAHGHCHLAWNQISSRSGSWTLSSCMESDIITIRLMDIVILHEIRYNLSVPMRSVKIIAFSNSMSQRCTRLNLDGHHIYEWLETIP